MQMEGCSLSTSTQTTFLPSCGAWWATLQSDQFSGIVKARPSSLIDSSLRGRSYPPSLTTQTVSTSSRPRTSPASSGSSTCTAFERWIQRVETAASRLSTAPPTTTSPTQTSSAATLDLSQHCAGSLLRTRPSSRLGWKSPVGRRLAVSGRVGGKPGTEVNEEVRSHLSLEFMLVYTQFCGSAIGENFKDIKNTLNKTTSHTIPHNTLKFAICKMNIIKVLWTMCYWPLRKCMLKMSQRWCSSTDVTGVTMHCYIYKISLIYQSTKNQKTRDDIM